ncbi:MULTISPECIES: GNAT family N-acetyltransferase [Clostridium]|uniref:GNAT family N-acetyltransferase n=1 Tax=Clostridium TaxID=1485 RepID=UPI00069D790D|nr:MULTISPECIES: GNAT family N-acetyltransferase [Clostridium]KOF57793.1 acetyltransferase [Clostridium sp. DMHC 10]MCD2349059.1 GNAT family N-acetyltransferase [Clostridium guangxiense]
MKLKNIVTDRLILIPITLQVAEALINGDNSEILKLGVKANKDWPTNDTMDILPIIVETLRNNAPSGFETWMIERKDSKEIIGDIGFHGIPDENGEVEIGYGLVENERRKGFGFEAAREIMDFAIAHKAVKVIKADCLINNLPSARILEKLEMKEVNRDDELIYWKYNKDRYAEIESIMNTVSEYK